MNPLTRTYDALASLKEFQKDFVIVPMDKTSNNPAIVCAQYYYDILKKELEQSNTYKQTEFN